MLVGSFFDFINRLFSAERSRFGKRENQGIKLIENENDAGTQRNLFTLQSIGVTAAVKGFMMVPDHGQHAFEGAQVGKDFFTHSGVLSHLNFFFVGSLIRFFHKCIRKENQTKIMHQTGKVDVKNIILFEKFKFITEIGAIACHALAMRF